MSRSHRHTTRAFKLRFGRYHQTFPYSFAAASCPNTNKRQVSKCSPTAASPPGTLTAQVSITPDFLHNNHNANDSSGTKEQSFCPVAEGLPFDGKSFVEAFIRSVNLPFGLYFPSLMLLYKDKGSFLEERVDFD